MEQYLPRTVDVGEQIGLIMAVHTRAGLGTITYRFWFGPLTPAWLDRAETPLTRFLSMNGNRLRLLRSEYRDA